MPSKTGSFHLGSTWLHLIQPRPKVTWHSLIWFKGMIPRYSFICWLAILNRLSTKDRQHRFNPDILPKCVLCGLEESRDHLFFACSFSSHVWSNITGILSQQAIFIWDQHIQWGIGLKRRNLNNTVSKLAWQSSIYHLWQERNRRIHRSQANTPHGVTDAIIQSLKMRILSFPSIQSLDPCTVQALGLSSNSVPPP